LARTWSCVVLAIILVFLILFSSAGAEKLNESSLVQKNPFLGNFTAIEKGEQLYKKWCEFCHGKVGEGLSEDQPDFTSSSWWQNEEDEDILRHLQDPEEKDVMGSWLRLNKEAWNLSLSREEALMVIAYLRSLSDPLCPSNKNLSSSESSRDEGFNYSGFEILTGKPNIELIKKAVKGMMKIIEVLFAVIIVTVVVITTVKILNL